MNDLDRAATIRGLQLRIETTTDPDERARLENELAEFEGRSLTGDAHAREGGGGST